MFGRSVTNGWGSADTGGSWAFVGGVVLVFAGVIWLGIQAVSRLFSALF